MSQFIRNDLKDSLNFFIDTNDQTETTIYELNRMTRKRIAWPELSMVNTLIKNHLEESKIFVAKPDQLIHLEDLATVFSLEELRNCFHEVIEYASMRQKEGKVQMLNQSDFL